jgi:hypothetical protein
VGIRSFIARLKKARRFRKQQFPSGAEAKNGGVVPPFSGAINGVMLN